MDCICSNPLCLNEKVRELERKGSKFLEGLKILPKELGSDVIGNKQKGCLYAYAFLKSDICRFSACNVLHFVKPVMLFKILQLSYFI